MTKDEALAMDLALEALEGLNHENSIFLGGYEKEITAIKKVRSAPVVCMACEGNPKGDNIPCAVCKATPPAAQRTWVGLTDHQRMMCRSYDVDEAIANTEAKLKEKNT
jgi:hypothetical protein